MIVIRDTTPPARRWLPRVLSALAFRHPLSVVVAAGMRGRVLAIVVLLGALAAGIEVTAQPLTPHVPHWERYFTVSWETFEWRGRPYLRGYVVNQYGANAWRVQLLVESLDESGHVAAQRVEWLGGDVPPFSRTYFEVPIPRPASSYRVRVFAFDVLQAALLQAP